MVGRELHTICPHGEDHQGLDTRRGARIEVYIRGRERRRCALKKKTVIVTMNKELF